MFNSIDYLIPFMPESRLEYLFNCYIRNNYTDQEVEELMILLANTENQIAVKELIDNVIENTGSEIQMDDQVAAIILQNILQKDKGIVVPIKSRKSGVSFWMRVAAAVILFVAGTSVYLVLNKKDTSKAKTLVGHEKRYPILQGGNNAVLTTSDGRTIILDSMQNGTLTQQGNTIINKQGGTLIYKVSTLSKSYSPVVYNTLSAPRGGQYAVVLSDGSKVWLNSVTTLHFPTAFTGSERVVELTGEAYFEVAKNKEKPFLVKVGNMQVKVLGTHFNIKAYSDENVIKTSLLEGSVNITRGNATGLLRPGEQALVNKEEDKIDITKANLDNVMAWRNGMFQFEGADITEIMREISRWYNVDIEYADKVPLRHFEGKISKNAQLSDVLRILELSNVKFIVKDNKIIVL